MGRAGGYEKFWFGRVTLKMSQVSPKEGPTGRGTQESGRSRPEPRELAQPPGTGLLQRRRQGLGPCCKAHAGTERDTSARVMKATGSWQSGRRGKGMSQTPRKEFQGRNRGRNEMLTEKQTTSRAEWKSLGNSDRGLRGNGRKADWNWRLNEWKMVRKGR